MQGGYEGRRLFDYIVVGCGGVGSAALYWLSKRAREGVLGLEQFELGHSNGGSQDHSRIIRLAYHDDIYTKLTPDTYKCWEEIEEKSGIQVLYRTGGLVLGRNDESEDAIRKYGDAMARHNIPFEKLTGSELHRKFPQFTTDDRYTALYQKDGGLVDAAMGNAVHVQLARGNDATVIDKCPVLKLSKEKSGLMAVHTTRGVFYGRKVIVTSGAWLNRVLGSIGVHIPVYVTQEQVTYLGSPNMKDFTKDKFPIWIYHSKTSDIYGMPIHGNTGVKIGVDAGGPVVTADTRTFTPDPERERVCIDLMKNIMPKGIGPILYSKTCLYTMTPDRNFVIDTCHRTGYDDVIVCNGAGHVFKFAGLMGKILSELAVDGRTKYDIAPFTMDREALMDPNYQPVFQMGTNKLPAGGGGGLKPKGGKANL